MSDNGNRPSTAEAIVSRQCTVAGPATLTGTALHSGQTCTVRLLPADPDHGVVFVRTDLPDKPRIPGLWTHITHRQRRTALAVGDAEVHMVEHLMSALRALGVDNVLVEVDNAELPGCDGSAADYVKLIDEGGISEQDVPRRAFVLNRTIEVQEEHANLVALPPIESEFQIFYTLDYNQHPLLKGFLDYTLTPESFRKEIAPARTFVMEQEALMLQKMGFGQGATTQNTLVVGDAGPIDNELRYPDECVRHKVLDVIGDLSLLGRDLRARIVSTRSGHLSNLKLVQKLAEEMARQEEASRVAERTTSLDIRQILEILPHRYPFVMLDRILELEPCKRAIGIKNVSINEPYFPGHFPQQPILPGVMLIEAMAQLGGLTLINHETNTGKFAYLTSLDNVRFRRTVSPGDQVRIEVEVVRSRPQTGQVACKATVNGKVAGEATIRYMILDPM